MADCLCLNFTSTPAPHSPALVLSIFLLAIFPLTVVYVICNFAPAQLAPPANAARVDHHQRLALAPPAVQIQRRPSLIRRLAQEDVTRRTPLQNSGPSTTLSSTTSSTTAQNPPVTSPEEPSTTTAQDQAFDPSIPLPTPLPPEYELAPEYESPPQYSPSTRSQLEDRSGIGSHFCSCPMSCTSSWPTHIQVE